MFYIYKTYISCIKNVCVSQIKLKINATFINTDFLHIHVCMLINVNHL